MDLLFPEVFQWHHIWDAQSRFKEGAFLLGWGRLGKHKVTLMPTVTASVSLTGLLLLVVVVVVGGNRAGVLGSLMQRCWNRQREQNTPTGNNEPSENGAQRQWDKVLCFPLSLPLSLSRSRSLFWSVTIFTPPPPSFHLHVYSSSRFHSIATVQLVQTF